MRNEEELARLCDYIHYNPVKHGLVGCPHEWPYSAFSRFVAQGLYPKKWGCRCESRPEIAAWLLEGSVAGE